MVVILTNCNKIFWKFPGRFTFKQPFFKLLVNFKKFKLVGRNNNIDKTNITLNRKYSFINITIKLQFWLNYFMIINKAFYFKYTYSTSTSNTKGEILGFSKFIIPFSSFAHLEDNAVLK